MGNLLDSPITTKHSLLYTSSTGLSIGATGMQGWRLEMEDTHITVDMPSMPNHTFLAVFDGHGGSGAAIYAEKNMVKFIEKTSHWNNYLASINNGAADLQLLGSALNQAFIDIDKAMRIHQASISSLSSSRDQSGCTSVTCMITPTHLVCANAGDSRCVMGYGSTEHEAMSQDHKPYDEIESKRIEAAGGTVQWKRVDGDLAVSRALGDFQYKSETLPPIQQKVCCVPDIKFYERTSTDDVLLLACDGLWDVMTNPEAIDKVRSIYSSGESSVVLIAEEMIDTALLKGSRDNISAIVVKLNGAVIGDPANGGVARMREERETRGRQPNTNNISKEAN